MEKLLIVDDEADLHRSFARLLADTPLKLLGARTGMEALKLAEREKPDLVVMDIRLGGDNGLDLLRQMRALDPKLLIIMMTAYGTTQTAIEAMKLGAYDYVLKPFDVPKLQALIELALKAARTMRQVVSYQPLLSQEEYDQGIVGKSEPMQKVYKLIGQVAPTDATVLLSGESGTGKELVARAIYHHSRRASQPFMAINCAAIPEQLLESELFGHEKGAFTGALARRIGKFEQCNGGTIFLDEIGDMTQPTQAKILRVLQEGTFERVGGGETIHTNVRVIAATNKDLEAAVAARQFREDLFYRLNVVRIHLPSLRDRREDIPLLVEYFLQKLRQDGRARVTSIAPAALERLKTYDWRGNVRELENALQYAVVVAKTDVVLVSDLPQEIGGLAPRTGQPRPRVGAVGPAPGQTEDDDITAAVNTLYRAARRDPKWKVMAAVERELIVRTLDETGGNQVQAAKLLGITRATLRKRIAKFGIQRQMQIQ